jgi:hypothetical protein
MKTKNEIRELIYANMGSDNSVHHAITNFCYDEFIKEEHLKNLSYNEFVEHIEKKYGKQIKFALEFSELNYQVCNGGWCQYFNNGYGNRYNQFVETFKELFSESNNEAVIKAIRLFNDIDPSTYYREDDNEDEVSINIFECWDNYYYAFQKDLMIFIENYLTLEFYNL